MNQSVTFAFFPDKIKAALVFAARQDIRYYLNGVQFQRHGDGAIAVATDGHRLAVLFEATAFSAIDGDGATAQDFSVIVSREQLESAVKAAPKNIALVFVVTVTDGVQSVTIKSDGAEFTHPAVDGRYPDWQRVIPTAESRGPCLAREKDSSCGYDAAYLGDYAKAAKALGLKSTAIEFRQDCDGYATIVRFGGSEDFVSVLMPVRSAPPKLPDWLQLPKPEKKLKAA